MQDWFKRDLTALAFCWRLQRRDGIVLGFTSHDRDLEIDGLLYRASPGMRPSAIEMRETLEADTLELGGALTSDLITEGDLDAGKWDGAALRLFAVDWNDPSAQPLFLAHGHFGAVENDGRAFAVELIGAAAGLDRPIVEATSPECRATLGDRRCRVDMAGRRSIRRVVASNGQSLTLEGPPLPPDAYAFGTVRWLDGRNAGSVADVATSDPSSVTLLERPTIRPEPGDRVLLSEGCDRRFSTCTARFANAANFRGEPHLPGNDLLVRYV
jgi:uncharacterized phage protein (TIGR02218 family)